MPTREEYMKQPIEERLARLESAPGELTAAIRGRGDADLSRRPVSNAWSAKEVVCHLRDIEEQFILRFRTMLAMDDPKFLTLGDMPSNPAEWGIVEGDRPPLDPERWVEERQYLRNDTGLALAAFQRRREETLAFLRRLAPAQWRRGSLHTTLGRMTVSDWVALIAAHDDKHIDQLDRALAGRT
jgi:hypothetical protein